MKLKKLFHTKSRAQALVEFAIALPLLLLLLYGIVEIGRFLFMYSTVVTASRSAVRYAATTGFGNRTDLTDPSEANEVRYQDCDGIRDTAQRYGFVGKFDTVDIYWDTGPSDTPKPYCVSTSAKNDPLVLTGNVNRINVTVSKEFVPIVPKLVPFARRTIKATSSRTLLNKITLYTTAVPSGKAATTVVITTNPNPSGVGESVTITVTVTGGSTPTGTVTISGDASCTITLSNGMGSCNVMFSSGGIKQLTATYNPDASHITSSATANHAVQFSTGLTINSHNPNPSQPNGSVNVVVTVNSDPTAPVPDGAKVNITGADTNCTITLTNGTGNCNVVFTSTGSKTITATYNPDPVLDPNHTGNSATADHAVLLGRTTSTTINSDVPDPSDIGQAVNVVVTVNGLGTTPTGTVNITGADTNCTITLVNGTGNCNVVFNTAGAKSITATYSGDATHDPSSTSTGHSVNLPITTTTITAHNPNPSVAGQTVSVTVTVTGGSTVATGTVTISGADVPCTITLANVGGVGTGSCNVVFSTNGTKTLSAAYNGDTQHAPSNATATHTVGNPSPTAVPGCSSVIHGAITKSGNTMYMTITNPYTYDLATGAGSVTWNSDKGNNSGDKHLSLMSATLNGTTIWSGGPTKNNVDTMPFTTPAVIPANSTVSIIFTFDSSYDNFDGTESIFVNLTTLGCNGFNIKSP